jgi:hypothetical protein
VVPAAKLAWKQMGWNTEGQMANAVADVERERFKTDQIHCGGWPKATRLFTEKLTRLLQPKTTQDTAARPAKVLLEATKVAAARPCCLWRKLLPWVAAARP